MKKVVKLLVVALLFISLGACSEENVNNDEFLNNNQINEENSNTTDEEGFVFVIDNHQLSFPITYQELQNVIGKSLCRYPNESYNTYVSSHLHVFEDLFIDDIKFADVTFFNMDNDDSVLEECIIAQIIQMSSGEYDEGLLDEKYKVVFPGGFKAGDEVTPDDITSVLGEPDEIHKESYADKEICTIRYKSKHSSTFKKYHDYFTIEIEKINNISYISYISIGNTAFPEWYYGL